MQTNIYTIARVQTHTDKTHTHKKASVHRQTHTQTHLEALHGTEDVSSLSLGHVSGDVVKVQRGTGVVREALLREGRTWVLKR